MSKTQLTVVRSSSPPDATYRPFMLPARIFPSPASPRVRSNPPFSLPRRAVFVRSSSLPFPSPPPGSRFLTSNSPFILPVSVARSASCPFSLPARRHNHSDEAPRIPMFSVRFRSPERSTQAPASAIAPRATPFLPCSYSLFLFIAITLDRCAKLQIGRWTDIQIAGEKKNTPPRELNRRNSARSAGAGFKSAAYFSRVDWNEI